MPLSIANNISLANINTSNNTSNAANQTSNSRPNNHCFNQNLPSNLNDLIQNLLNSFTNCYRPNHNNNNHTNPNTPVNLNTPVNPNNPVNPNTPVITGGFSQVATTDPNVKSAANFAAQKLTNGQAGIKSINSAEQQVVAGMNYRMNVELTNGDKYNVTVYKNLQGEMSLSASTKIK
jgi:hypothetical protein